MLTRDEFYYQKVEYQPYRDGSVVLSFKDGTFNWAIRANKTHPMAYKSAVDALYRQYQRNEQRTT